MVLENTGELRQKAKGLRQAKDFKGAKGKYADLWEDSHDVWDGTGLLHCLRKLGEFEEAIPLADELLPICEGNDWCRNEIIWTYISGVLSKLEENEPLAEVVKVADRILNLKPDGPAFEKTLFEVLDRGKKANDWKTVNGWLSKIDPNALSSEPISVGDGREGWSRRAQWYNLRIKALIELGQYPDAIALDELVTEQFPKQRKFFLRLKGLAYYRSSELEKAKEVYCELCSHPKTDWWLLNEYARVLVGLNLREDALNLMYSACLRSSKLELMVSMFDEIGGLCIDLNRFEEAIAHCLLAKYLREEKGWSIPNTLTEKIQKVNSPAQEVKPPRNLKEALDKCKDIWKAQRKMESNLGQTEKTGLHGLLNLGNPDRTFCFIRVRGDQDYFCFKADLPSNAIDGERLNFDLVKSFDKKKQKDSFRATNVRRF